MNYPEALQAAHEIIKELEPYCEQIEIAGSIRRKKQEGIKDVEVVCVRKPSRLVEFKAIVDGWYKVKGEAIGLYTQRIVDGVKLDLFMPNADNFGIIYLLRTGPKDFSARMVARELPSKGFKADGGYIWRMQDGRKKNRLLTPSESTVFNLIGMDFVEPEARY